MRIQVVGQLINLTSFLLFSIAYSKDNPLKINPELLPEKEFIAYAEKIFYDMENLKRLDKTQEVLEKRLKVQPKDAYALWARARLSYFRKDHLFSRELMARIDGKTIDLKDEKLKLGEECHIYADRCIDASPQTPECHLSKAACYAMECSTIGPSLLILPKIKRMDRALKKASQYPSDIMHVGGKLSTAEFADTMRGIMYRLIPDSIWFYLLTGVRGKKDLAYDLIKRGVVGKLDNEHMFILELAATAYCLSSIHKGNEELHKKYFDEGTLWLNKGLALPARHPMDKFDRLNMEFLKKSPEEGCNYRREKFENTQASLNSLK